jgi:integrase
MPVRREPDGRWRYRAWVKLPSGLKTRISGTAPKQFNTKQAALQAEREHILRLTNPAMAAAVAKPTPKRKEVPTFEQFVPEFDAYATSNNKPSEVDSKRAILRAHLVPAFGRLPLDEIGERRIEAYKARKLADELCKKTVNNHLTVLRRLLVLARRFKLIEHVPEIMWLKAPKPEFDFLAFDEADRLIAGADGEWQAMVLVALRTGMRQGELLGLRWEDVDLTAGRLLVRQAITRGVVGTPKSGKPRELPLSDQALTSLKRHRHLRGELVFCDVDGKALEKGACKWPLWRACKRAGLRRIGWHVLRHSFASHLAMRGVPLKAVQELLGHATIEMTMRYAHLSPTICRDAVQALDAPAPTIGQPNPGQMAPAGNVR